MARGVAWTSVNFGSTSSTPPGACGFSLGVPSTSKTVSSNHFASSARSAFVGHDDLALTLAVAQDHEVDPRERAVVEEPALELDPLADVFLEFGGPDSHRGNATARPLNRCDARTG